MVDERIGGGGRDMIERVGVGVDFVVKGREGEGGGGRWGGWFVGK